MKTGSYFESALGGLRDVRLDPAEIGDWLRCYEEMADAMYTLRRRIPRLSLLGTRTVHPRHPAPDGLLRLVDACVRDAPRDRALALRSSLDADPDWRWIARIVARWYGSFLRAVAMTRELTRLRTRCSGMLEGLAPADVIFKTWRYGDEPEDGSDDFYFGSLPLSLRKRGLKAIVLYGNARPPGETPRAFWSSRGEVVYVPERLLVPLAAPAMLCLDQLFTALQLHRRRRSAGAADDWRMAAASAEACAGCLRPEAVVHGLYYHIAREAVRRWRPRAFVSLYEGHPVEQLMWRGVRAADPSCAIVGYQHAVLTPLALSVLRPQVGGTEPATPDTVLCLGEETRRLLERGHRAFGSRLVPFGSYRHRPAAGIEMVSIANRRTILVLPEGLLLEASLLFGFALRVARRMPRYRFVFRCHPALPFEEVAGELEGDPDEPPNVEVSRRHSISEDFALSSVVLYRGSSAVLAGVLHGMKPIYLHVPGQPYVDPLFRLPSWREIVSSEEGFAAAVHGYFVESPDTLTEQWRKASEYVERYASAVDQAAVDRFLTEALGVAAAGTG